MLNIIKKNRGKYLVFDTQYLGSEVHLDFSPFLALPDVNQGLLIHLRARPPQLSEAWTYGIYRIENDEYISVDHLIAESVEFKSLKISKLIKPTDVFFCANADIKINNDEETGLITGFIHKQGIVAQVTKNSKK